MSVLEPMRTPLITKRTRAYFAPVNRSTGAPTIFDPAVNASWNLCAPAAPWVDLGWVTAFTRTADSKIAAVDAGAPAVVQVQARQSLGAMVSFRFENWSKLSMALATSSQHMNLLLPAAGVTANGSGGKAVTAAALGAGSTANVLYMASGLAASLQAGAMVVVDEDYAGQTGFVGAGAAGSWVESAAAVGNDPDSIRRVSLNVGKVVAVGGDGGLQLASPLLAGTPTATMKVQQVVGFVDREGGTFFPEWSALFVTEGSQGELLIHHYPRLQPCVGAAEAAIALSPSLELSLPAAKFRALPVVDVNDSAQVLCYRSFIPGTASHI